MNPVQRKFKIDLTVVTASGQKKFSYVVDAKTTFEAEEVIKKKLGTKRYMVDSIRVV